MTTIAFKSGVIAGDTVVYDIDKIRHMTKIEKFNSPKFNCDILIGVSGDVRNMKLIIDWFKRGEESDPKFPSDSLDALVWDGKTLWNFDTAMVPLKINEEMWAVGSGAKFAIGAMVHGATAELGVATAISYDPGSGGQIETLTLDN